MRNETRDILSIFVEKARLLTKGEFVRYARENGLAVQLEVNYAEQRVATAHLRPETEALLAMANTFRFFLQKNEPISFQNLPKLYPDLPANLATYCTNIINTMNARLNFPPYGLQIAGTPTTLENIKEVFVYGELSHSTQRERYKQWENNRAAFPLLRFYFDNAVAEVVDAIFTIAYITELELNGKPTPSLECRFCWARLIRLKEAGEWKRVTPKEVGQKVFRRLEAETVSSISSSQPLPTLGFH